MTALRGDTENMLTLRSFLYPDCEREWKRESVSVQSFQHLESNMSSIYWNMASSRRSSVRFQELLARVRCWHGRSIQWGELDVTWLSVLCRKTAELEWLYSRKSISTDFITDWEEFEFRVAWQKLGFRWLVHLIYQPILGEFWTTYNYLVVFGHDNPPMLLCLFVY